MHCLLSTCHLLLILIPFEEPPHLTADMEAIGGILEWSSTEGWCWSGGGSSCNDKLVNFVWLAEQDEPAERVLMPVDEAAAWEVVGCQQGRWAECSVRELQRYVHVGCGEPVHVLETKHTRCKCADGEWTSSTSSSAWLHRGQTGQCGQGEV